MAHRASTGSRFARVGVIEPTDLDDYREHGGLRGLERALAAGAASRSSPRSPPPACAAVAVPGSRPASSGRPCARRPPTQKFVCCNADEGDCGTFADRMLMEGDPVHAHRGHDDRGARRRRDRGLRLRPLASTRTPIAHAAPRRSTSRTRHGCARRRRARQRRARSTSTCGSAPAPTSAAKRPRCSRASRASAAWSAPSRRCRPSRGCSASRRWSTTCSRWRRCPIMLADGARGLRRARHRPLARHPGLPARRQHQARRPRRARLRRHAARARRTTSAAARHPGGRSARCRSAARSAPTCHRPQFDLPLDYEAFAEVGAMVGHGGIVVFDDTVDMAGMARFAMEFCAIESCGKCTPCRIGSTRGVEVIDRIRSGRQRGAPQPRAARGPVRRR